MRRAKQTDAVRAGGLIGEAVAAGAIGANERLAIIPGAVVIRVDVDLRPLQRLFFRTANAIAVAVVEDRAGDDDPR